jgi:hypothetical protein
MKKLMIATALVALVFLAVPASIADDSPAKSVTVTGEILDMACYIGKGAKGPDHAGCAKSCVKGGQPMGLLTEDGTVFLLVASHENGGAFEKAKDLAGTKVEIMGPGLDRAGIKAVEVHSVKAL